MKKLKVLSYKKEQLAIGQAKKQQGNIGRTKVLLLPLFTDALVLKSITRNRALDKESEKWHLGETILLSISSN